MERAVDHPVYLDNAATTPLDGRVAEVVVGHMRGPRGNPSSLHAAGAAAKDAIEDARRHVAALISASPEEIVFTSGGTEADNLAVLGLAAAAPEDKRHIVVSPVEHAAVRETVKHLERNGFEVSWVGVDEYGRVDPEEFASLLRDNTAFASVMWANNEVGTVQPVRELAESCSGRGIPFHSDAVQAAGRLPIDVNDVPVSTLALSSHKLYGPQGAGALYVRDGVSIAPIVFGGGQERGLRSGTEDAAGLAGFGEAARLAAEEFDERVETETQLRDELIAGLKGVGGITLNGHPDHRLPNNVHVTVEGAEAESLVLMLDAMGFAVGKGSACSSSEHKASPVLRAMGQGDREAFSALRISVGKDNTREEVRAFLQTFSEVVARLRELSPVGGTAF